MTIVEVMDELAAYIRDVVSDYSSEQKEGTVPVEVYAGFPPVRGNPKEQASFIYALVTDFEDGEDGSIAKAEIGFSIYDEDKTDGWRSLYNLMEHVRQNLLKHPCLAGRVVLHKPMKGSVSDGPLYPNWEGKIVAEYAIGQPTEEGIEYDRF